MKIRIFTAVVSTLTLFAMIPGGKEVALGYGVLRVKLPTEAHILKHEFFETENYTVYVNSKLILTVTLGPQLDVAQGEATQKKAVITCINGVVVRKWVRYKNGLYSGGALVRLPTSAVDMSAYLWFNSLDKRSHFAAENIIESMNLHGVRPACRA